MSINIHWRSRLLHLIKSKGIAHCHLASNTQAIEKHVPVGVFYRRVHLLRGIQSATTMLVDTI
jgi:hypothetical protein